MTKHHGTARRLAVAVLAASVMVLAGATAGSGNVGAAEVTRYNVILAGTPTEDGFALAGTRDAALALVGAAGGSVVHDLSSQIGVLTVESPNTLFLELIRSSPLVADAAEDFSWQAFPSYEEAIDAGSLTLVAPEPPPGGGPEPSTDLLEGMQWSMQLIRTEAAHAIQAGSRAVQVGILDTGIDSTHPDFAVDTAGPNVDCTPPEAADFTATVGGVPGTCTDNQFHGTHVAGIVAAQANGVGVVGVAPNVTVIPVKVCNIVGFCFASSTAAGITHAGDQKFEVINMSFFVDDAFPAGSTEFKCNSDPAQRVFRHMNELAIQYARNQGVVPVAALGNSDANLADPPDPYENECEVVPAETQGVIGTMALGPDSEKAYYSSYGVGATDVAAPGGNSRNDRGETPGSCQTQVLSTIPGVPFVGAWGCFQGTSMASPHAAGVAALIVSQFGRVGTDAGETDVVMRPQQVEDYLQSTTIDLYTGPPFAPKESLKGYDGCFGNGRIDAVKAVTHDTSMARHLVEAPLDEDCPSFFRTGPG